ncbi:alpha,alpha-phosphotrehalase [Evansella tamaricis]|uniref:Alpha,alpha-phosphotrehalase n=1 Tax=Evansella tamaricis TaxID=2069301 RepID=A0ABS6JGR2_9BACI|nr:alpha,alpha-phosphotrehalase [Evansella tamaricis]MBU9712877.1 alpha,alpha-phosphotrehalase [Evansella tamaricis]
MKKEEWWRKAVVYQIYPKSFNDTTGTGSGDLQGIINRLDYLKTLGIDVIWLTPIYSSPQRDNGYDIRDYYSVHEEYGTMEDFDRLLEESHKRDIKVIMDIVVNHTSTEHPWFQEASKSKDNPYRDFYIWKDPVDGEEPTNWISKFGGSAWEFDDKTGQYYLHLFDVTQADLNWEKEEVRERVYEMMEFWFDKGVDGFRLDVINLISKDQNFPNDDGRVPPGDGRKFYTDGPRIHEYMQEMNEKIFSKYHAVTVGEMSSTTIDHCIKYTNPDRNELSMIFTFHHLKVDYPNGEKWAIGAVDFQALKDILSKWQVEMYKGGGWNALFWCNHDQPRVVTRYGNDGKYHQESAKMLATLIHMMQGTPYIYQGEEFGMTDPKFDSISQYRDVETFNYYEIMKKQGVSEKDIMDIIKRKSRDNSRTPVQWDDTINAGFTTGTPWIDISDNYPTINAKSALNDKNSVFYHYQKLIKLRKKYDIITYGDFELIYYNHKQLFTYIRRYNNEVLLVVNNFYADEVSFEIPKAFINKEREVLLSNYDNPNTSTTSFLLRPYESVVYYFVER